MKKTTFFLFLIMIIALTMTSCSALPISRPVSDNQMQTEIAQILTAMVTETPAPLIEATATEPVAAPTEQPLESTAESNVPTVEIGQLATSTPGEETFISTPAPLPEEGNPPGTLEPIPTSKNQQSTTSAVATSESTPTQTISDPVLTLGEPTWKDTFDTGDNWGLGTNEFMTSKVVDGTLQMVGLKTKNGWILSRQKAANFYLQLTGKMSTCSGADNYGLFFRAPSLTYANRGYLYGISCDGKFALREWNVDKMAVLQDWKTSNSILKGSNQVNRLGIMAQGNVLKLYVNGVLVDTVKDSTFDQGYLGLYIGRKVTTNLTAVLDEISFWDLP